MLEVTKKGFISIHEHDQLHHSEPRDNRIAILYSIPETFNANDYIEVEIKYKVPSFTITLRPMEYNLGTFYHMITDGKMNYSLFMAVLKHLKREVPEADQKLNWNIYNGQPIWEFGLDAEILKTHIKKFHSRIEVKVGQ